MACQAKQDQQKRLVTVDRLKLLERLKKNRHRHIEQYKEAMSGYKAQLLQKIEEAFAEAKSKLEARYDKMVEKAQAMTDADIEKQGNYHVLIDSITVEMQVPRCYAEEYDAAIDMMSWDTRDQLELTHAEFTCFVRDKWDWKSNFESVSMLYSG